jgi:ATP-dependent DNA helicase DinG
MAHEIARAGGNEVFFLGRVEAGVVVDVEVLARGNADSAPAILQIPAPGDVVLHNHPSGGLEPSPADMGVASYLGGNSVGFLIVDNPVENVYQVVKHFAPQTRHALDARRLNDALVPGGALSAALPALEDRPAQHAMLGEVSRAFNEGKVAVLEAGTGTGKTLAYLLPAVDWALANGEKVVVATHTINLQEQILNKDVPALRSLFGDKFKVTLVKGRSNYLSRRRARELEQGLGTLVDDAEQAEARALIEWAKTTPDGTRSDLPFQAKHDLWEKIQSEGDNCLRLDCPTFTECFFFRARRQALEAHVLVANHHLVFADLAVRAAIGGDEGGILPAYKRLVLDEAHHVEEVATEYFGRQAARAGFNRALNRLLRETPRGDRGALPNLLHRLAVAAPQLPEGMAAQLAAILTTEVRPARATLDFVFGAFFDHLHLFAREGTADAGGELRTLRLAGDVLASPAFRDVQIQAENALETLKLLVDPAARFVRRASAFAAEGGFQGPLKEFASAVDRLAGYGDAVRDVLLADSRDMVRWVETKAFQARIVSLKTAPLEVAARLEEQLFRKHETVVLTSATLTVAGKTDYLRARLGLNGLEAERLVERQYASPFDFATQARLFVVDDLPAPDKPEYERALEPALERILCAAGGRAFVLFTSFRSLDRQFRAVEPVLRSLGIRCFKQGETSRDKLLTAFRDDVKSVLFGTDSFWEGVDVEGESLSTVVLTRLPFRVPTDPVLVARAEAIEAAGGRAFNELTVPMAVIKFRQGFGRLIRSKTDRGVVVVTDRRIVSRPYGRAFLESLPPVPVDVAGLTDVEQDVRRFFYTG